MRFDIHIRQRMRERLAAVSSQMVAWDLRTTPSVDLHHHLVEAIRPFSHTTKADHLLIGGVDGSGDFPVVSYGDSFVYATVAAASLYQSDPVHGLREMDFDLAPLVEFTWLSSSEQQRKVALFESFEKLAGHSVEEIIDASDYRRLGRSIGLDIPSIIAGLIVPPGHDAGNIGVQLRMTAELSAALRLIERAPAGSFVLSDGTMSLPFVQRTGQSLFFEHLRRYCCVRARERGVVFMALSKSHGLPSGISLEQAAREKLGGPNPDHWYLMVPNAAEEHWSPFASDGPRVPPVGAATYLVRLHLTTPVMRLDLDANYWEQRVAGSPDEERRIFESLDYASHDQRSFGYPYPIKAAHDRASLTGNERIVLKKQVIDVAVQAGLKRSLFRDAAQATGHA